MLINFSSTAPDMLDCDLIVVGVNEEERPPQSAAGLIDWRLHGFLSSQIKKNTFTAAPGEFLLVPGDHRLRCKWVLIVGLGSCLEVDASVIHHFCSQSLNKAKQLSAKSCMLIYPNVMTTAPFYREALKWFLEGVSKAAAENMDSDFFDTLDLYLPSKLDERVDLSSVMMPKLLSKHGLTFTSTDI